MTTEPAELLAPPHRPIPCRSPLPTPKWLVNRDALEAMVRKATAAGSRYEVPGGDHLNAKIQKFMAALQGELIAAEGFPAAK